MKRGDQGLYVVVGEEVRHAIVRRDTGTDCVYKFIYIHVICWSLENLDIYEERL